MEAPELEPIPADERGPYVGKRAVDLALIVVGAIPALVVGGAGALGVRLTSPGPVLFRQQRVGRNGVLFEVIKLRTMRHEPELPPGFPDAARITRVGRLLRRLSLDELPQLINVARGEMSVVGPRPTLSYQVERYDERQRARLSVRPGMTGLAQVRGRNRIVWAERIEHDLEYLHRQSPWLDLRLVLESVGVALRGGGVEGHPVDDVLAQLPE